MSNLKPGVRDVRKLAVALEDYNPVPEWWTDGTEVAEPEFESAEDMARAALEAAFELYEAKSKFVVAGQLYYSPALGFVRDSEDLVLLGPYGTHKQAETAGQALAGSAVTGEQFRWWVLPITHGTPHAWFTARKKARIDEALAESTAEQNRRRWLAETLGHDKAVADVIATMLDQPTLADLKTKYPDSGWEPAA